MDLYSIKLFAMYNERTNIKMNEIISELSNIQWERQFNGYFNSIKSMCNHIYIGDFNWLKRFSNLRQFKYIRNGIFKQTIRFDEAVLESIQDYKEKRGKLDICINEFVNELKREDLEKDLKYIDSHGKEYKRNFGGLILHMFNHETHHRGMVSIYLEEMKIANDYSNLMDML